MKVAQPGGVLSLFWRRWHYDRLLLPEAGQGQMVSMLQGKTVSASIVGVIVLLFLASAHATELIVSPAGNDSNPGTAEKPVATLEHARDLARMHKPSHSDLTILLHEGVYPVSKTLELTAEDSGVAWRAVKVDTVVFSAGRTISPEGWKPVMEAAVVARLDPSARSHILQLDLKPLGLQHAGPFPDAFGNGGGIVRLFCDGRFMPISRWPNDGYTTVEKVVDAGDWAKGPNRHGGSFIARDERVARWAVDRGVWLDGYWRVPWEPTTLPREVNRPRDPAGHLLPAHRRRHRIQVRRTGRLGQGELVCR